MTNAEGPYELPEGWEWTTLEDVIIRISNGITKRQNKEKLGYPVTRIETISNEVINLSRVGYLEDLSPQLIEKYILNKGDILFSHINSDSHLGKTAIFKSDSFVLLHGMNLLLIRANNGVIIPNYLNYMFNYYRFSGLFYEIAQHAVNQSSINQAKLKKLVVPLPPLPEQRRIVARIEELFTQLDAGVSALEKSRAQLARYRQSVLKAAVEGRLTEKWRATHPDVEPASALLERILTERRVKWEEEELAKLVAKGKRPKNDRWKQKYKEPLAPETEGLPELPEGWNWANLGQLKEFSLYGPRFSSDDYSENGYLVLRTSDISDSGKVNINTAPKLSLSEDQFSKYKVELGDLLITRTGSLGTLAVFNDTVDAIPGAYLIQYRLIGIIKNSWYLFYFLKSPSGQNQLTGGGAGVGRPNLNAPTIEAIPITFPPLPEQHEIVSEIERLLTVADQTAATIAANLKRAAHLRQSILKKAFRGDLVSQDPNDEPASLLLERIMAERAKAPPKGRKARPRKKKAAKTTTQTALI